MVHLQTLISLKSESKDSFVILPSNFDFKLFLEKQANINSFSTCIDWLEENDEINYRTKKRFLDICWSIYGKKISFLDTDIVNYHKKFIKRYWKIKIENNSLQSLLTKYVEDNKNKWEKISFHIKNIKNIILDKF